MHKAIPFRIPKSEKRALRIQEDRGEYFYDQLHYHPEFQLTMVVKGSGILYAGNGISQFRSGDVFLVGSDVPHVLKNDEAFYSEDSAGVYSISVFFDYESFGHNFFQIRELQKLKKMLDSSDRVLIWEQPLKSEVEVNFYNLLKEKNEGLIIGFLQLISILQSMNCRYINAHSFNNKMKDTTGTRLNEIVQFCFENYREEIRIEDVSKLALLSRSQFSQFFKKHTGKSFVEFLNRYRIEKACSELIDGNSTINHICYATGFRNISNFNRQFNKIKGMSPGAYRRMWKVSI